MKKFDSRVLEAIKNLQPLATGNTIEKFMREHNQWRWWNSLGSIWVALERLQEAGLIRGEWIDGPYPRRRRYIPK